MFQTCIMAIYFNVTDHERKVQAENSSQLLISVEFLLIRQKGLHPLLPYKDLDILEQARQYLVSQLFDVPLTDSLLGTPSSFHFYYF